MRVLYCSLFFRLALKGFDQAFSQVWGSSLRSQGISPVKSLDFFLERLFSSAPMGVQRNFTFLVMGKLGLF
jgi:hypothetical protein